MELTEFIKPRLWIKLQALAAPKRYPNACRETYLPQMQKT